MQADKEARIQAIRQKLAEKNLDALMVSLAENRFYLSGFSSADIQCDEYAAHLFITREKLVLATSSIYALAARQECPGWEIFCHKEGLAKALPEIVQKHAIRSMGFEDARLTVRVHAEMAEALKKAGLSTSFRPCQGMVEGLRVIKSGQEVLAMKKALDLAERAFESVLPRLACGMTEKQAAWLLESAMREAGAEGMAFPIIVAAGENAALPHAVPGDRPIQPGAPLLFDWGARLGGYCSDISRTVVLGAGRDTLFKKVFQAVSEAQEKATQAIRPGAVCKAVDAVARGHIAAMGFGQNFTHGLGHGVGLAVHEAPSVRVNVDTVLEPGMVCTVEPGIYIQGWGGVRLENMVVVTQDGAEVLNSLNEDLLTSL